jgi:anthraniloyl-CoA monooxygenase
VDFVHANSAAKIGLQLSHSGRKGSCTLPWEGGEPLKNGWGVVGPVAKAYDAISPVPRALTEEELDGILADYRAATLRAKEAGFDWLEIHMAHGYLLSTFVSPLTNLREDGYGGENRLRFPLEVIGAVRACWQGPISVRISATEWAPGGLSDADRAFLGRAFKNAGADMITASGGGVVPWGKPVYGRMFQVQFAEQIRYDAGIPTMAVGNIQDVDQINTIVAAGRADLCAVARGHLSDPVFSQRAAARYNVDMRWPVQYLAAKPSHKKR